MEDLINNILPLLSILNNYDNSDIDELLDIAKYILNKDELMLIGDFIKHKGVLK